MPFPPDRRVLVAVDEIPCGEGQRVELGDDGAGERPRNRPIRRFEGDAANLR
ncbi:MAG: hypothetical protein IPK17_25220 [Chloroflexi bacterium]|uniref:hypothetical protein n=1 Tax=Candidatus Flexifilum breve TaxID=3140694 RepID=UPI0031368CCE|nr:hypothetical protein [Chloroflexota bacterium]